jgi:hypothetical protein
MVELTANSGPGHGFWGGHLLDRFVAPELSKLKKCSAPEIPEPPNYFAAYFLNNALGYETPHDTRLLEASFLRKWTVAVREYRSGREHLARFVFDLQRTNNQVGLFLTALADFENCAINAYLALMASAGQNRLMQGAAYQKPFAPEDGSPFERLNAIYNEVKHFHSRDEKGRPLTDPAPVWIVNDGLKCRRKRNGQEHDVVLTFEELVAILEDQTEGARILSRSST